MALFGRNKNEDYEDEDESPRKIRDLRPENRKARKEPPKPWTKRERMIVLIAILITVVTAAILAFSNQAHLSFNFPKINLLKEETIEIRKK